MPHSYREPFVRTAWVARLLPKVFSAKLILLFYIHQFKSCDSNACLCFSSLCYSTLPCMSRICFVPEICGNQMQTKSSKAKPHCLQIGISFPRMKLKFYFQIFLEFYFLNTPRYEALIHSVSTPLPWLGMPSSIRM